MDNKNLIIFLLFVLIILCIFYPRFDKQEKFSNWVQVNPPNQIDVIETDNVVQEDIISENVVADYRITAGQGNCTNCNPKCSWKCDKPVCNKICKPKCEQPSCFINCSDPGPAACSVECQPPQCEVICPKVVDNICEKNPCRIKCKDPVCKVNCVKPKPFCEVNCDPPRCNWECRKPDNCPEPNCRMVCDN